MSTKNSMHENMKEDEAWNDPEEILLEQVRDVLKSLGKAYTALKIYPFDNPSVINSAHLFAQKLMKFLEEHEELRIEIKEFSLAYNGQNLYTDEEKKKSLPFLLYKDGMRELSFHHGLDDGELDEFLKAVKENADLPEEDCEIINSLWEKDFAQIRYIALDEFLDTQIGDQNEDDGLNPDIEEFASGKIELSRADMQDIEKQLLTQPLDPGNDTEKQEDDGYSPREEFIPEAAVLSENDIPAIESLISKDRESSRLRELITLLFEVLFLEERKDQFAGTLNVLHQYLKETLQKNNYPQAALILSQIEDLRASLPEKLTSQILLLDRFITKMKEKAALDSLEKAYSNGLIQDFPSYLKYLHFLCPETIPLLIDIWEKTEKYDEKKSISHLFQDIGEKNIEALVKITEQNSLPLAKEIISILGKIDKLKSLPFLKKFAQHSDKSIRMETILAIKNLHDLEGDKILLDLLHDSDEEIRIMAATSLNHIGNPKAVNKIMEIISKNDFHKKNRTEKRAFLAYLSQNNNPDIIFFLHSILKKKSLFPSRKAETTRLCVVGTLETIATPEAVNVLKEGTYTRKKRIRIACKLALRKLAARHVQYREIEVI